MSPTSPPSPAATRFSDLALGEPLLHALRDVGYEAPSPIQAAIIPSMLAGRDVLGQAQTGTGKTAAFALPILARLELQPGAPQALVLAPTRELAIQVAEAFQRYASHLPGFHVLPVYGGQSYGPQLSALRRGVHVIVGTPGRVIDHLEKGSLDLSTLRTLVLDEADEMLRMGFIDDVERILRSAPAGRQTALFSATMPHEIKRIAKTYLNDPVEVTVAARTSTADNIRQRYWMVSGMHKLDALTRILEAEPFDGMIIFVRTKLGADELAQKLLARGFSAGAIHGDLQQQQRERTIGQLKEGGIDILVATDVAARGLDVDRISHVVNYDVPADPESYVHRIGRTGRAGRKGEAILFITPRERGLLRSFERSTRQAVSVLEVPTIQAVNNVRIARFKEQISATLAAGELELFTSIVEDYERENDVPAVEIAAALAKMSRRGVPLLLGKGEREGPADIASGKGAGARRPPAMAAVRDDRRPAATAGAELPAGGPRDAAAQSRAPRRAADPDRASGSDAPSRPVFTKGAKAALVAPGVFRVEVGSAHGVKPGNLVGAIANESGFEARAIGRIEIFDTYSLVEMTIAMSQSALDHLQAVQVSGRPLRMRPGGEMPPLRGGKHQGAAPPPGAAPSRSRATAPPRKLPAGWNPGAAPNRAKARKP